MIAKTLRHPNKVKTRLTNDALTKVRSAEYLERSLSAGSKNRLSRYRESLAESRGVGEPLFDSKVEQTIRRYVWNAKTFDDVVAYLNQLRDADGHLFSRNLKLYEKISDAMARFASPDHTSFRWNRNYVKSLESMRKEFSRLKLKPIHYGSDDDIMDALPKANTHSGYEYILSGKRTKGENVEGALTVFRGMIKRSLESNESFKKPIMIAFRTQASGEFNDDGTKTNVCKHKTRVVSMYDFYSILLELMFSLPVQEYMSKQKYYAGGKDDRQINLILQDYSVRNQRFFSIDYSSFDQTISSWLIEDVFSVIKSAFILNDDESKLFDFMVNDFIHKDFIVHEGILHSDKGVPSGSMWTQIVDTLVNLLVVRTFFNSISADCDMIAMGDDNAIFTRGIIQLEDLSSYLGKNFGLVVKVEEKTSVGICLRDKVKFLSRQWRPDGPWRHPNQLISRLLFPERFRNYQEEVKPEHVIWGYILSYKVGMQELIDIGRFRRDFPLSSRIVSELVDSRYLPGALRYITEYTKGETAQSAMLKIADRAGCTHVNGGR